MAPIPKSQTQKTGITVPPKWKERTPAFLFRGWKYESGGNSKLNSEKAITPHAFYEGEPSNKSISKIPETQLRSEIDGHLFGSRVKSHFSSWAADLQTALGFAGVSTSAHISVFETSLRGQHNEIYHVPALNAMGLTHDYYPEEYLVYGPVSGEAHTCVSVMRLRGLGLNMTVASRGGVTSKVSVAELRHSEKIAYEFRKKSDMDSKGPSLFLTVFAAELGRLLRATERDRCGAGWSQKDTKAILSYLSALGVVDRAAKQPHKKSLVNPKTFVNGFPQLKAMVDILMTLDVEIDRKRSKMSKLPSSNTLESSKSGTKRKADDASASKDPVNSQVQSMNTVDAQAQSLQAEFISLLKGSLQRVNVPDSALNDTTGCKNPMDSYFDSLIKWAQNFDNEMHHAQVSISALHKSCNALIGSIKGQKARHASGRPGPGKLRPASTSTCKKGKS